VTQTQKTRPTRKIMVPQSLIRVVGIAVANQIQARHTHASHCKETPSECRLCKDTIAYVGALPPEHSAVALENPQAPAFTQRFSALIMDSANAALMQGTQRATRDYHVTASLFAYHRDHYPNEYPRRQKTA
jgi:hypothetical protein